MSESNELTLIAPESQLDLDAAVAIQQAYLSACHKLLDREDYAIIRGRKFRKRSGWAKLRRAFNVSTEIVREEYVEYTNTWGYKFVIRASLPNGRREEADGLCTAYEVERERVQAARKRKQGAALTPIELEHIRGEITRQIVRGKALTRGKSRATSDVLGAGIVSAEEVVTDAKHWIDSPPVRKRFWAWAKGTLKLSEDEIHEGLGVEHVRDYGGTMKEAKAVLEAFAIDTEAAE